MLLLIPSIRAHITFYYQQLVVSLLLSSSHNIYKWVVTVAYKAGFQQHLIERLPHSYYTQSSSHTCAMMSEGFPTGYSRGANPSLGEESASCACHFTDSIWMGRTVFCLSCGILYSHKAPPYLWSRLQQSVPAASSHLQHLGDQLQDTLMREHICTLFSVRVYHAVQFVHHPLHRGRAMRYDIGCETF